MSLRKGPLLSPPQRKKKKGKWGILEARERMRTLKEEGIMRKGRYNDMSSPDHHHKWPDPASIFLRSHSCPSGLCMAPPNPGTNLSLGLVAFYSSST